MSKPLVSAVRIHKIREGSVVPSNDLLAVEEPLEIRLTMGKGSRRQERRLLVTMRTPGHDFELALGFLFAEGILHRLGQVKEIRYCTEIKRPEEVDNILLVKLADNVEIEWEHLERNFISHSSCGVCGKGSIEALQLSACPSLKPHTPVFSTRLINELPVKCMPRQTAFSHTGGLHAAALFDQHGTLLLVREDIGRHNAMDKLLGAAWGKGMMPLDNHLVFWSGRASFELVQKSLAASIPLVAAVGAPSSLAVHLSKDFGQTLLGFVRENRFNIYAGAERIDL
jgi:FdhD protein